MKFSIVVAFLCFLCFAEYRASAANRGISLQEKIYAADDLLITQSVFTRGTIPCSSFLGFETSGEQTSAEWVRMVFHDFVTADVKTGTGGLDASILYESNRAENTGLHFINDTRDSFLGDVSAYVSMSDMIVMGAIMALTSCSGQNPAIPIRVGRIDATEAGPAGVPEAFTDLNTTLAAFAKAGFNQSEAIMAVACGHSLGGVHERDFPDIVEKSAVTPNNTDGTATFDSTPDVFDHIGVSEYLTGTGKCGGPLVIGFNETNHSDLRLFNSDNNVTMQSLATPDAFKEKCAYIFGRMMNTVPANVELSEPLESMKWKMSSYEYQISDDGVLSLSGVIRYLCGPGKSCLPAPATLSYTYTVNGETTDELTTFPMCDSNKTIHPNCRAFNTVTPFYGNFSTFSFISNLTAGTTTINVENEYTYGLETNVAIIPSRSLATIKNFDLNNTIVSVFAVARTSLVEDDTPMSVVVYAAPVEAHGVLLTLYVTEVETQIPRIGTLGEYTVFSGNVTVPGFTSPVVQVGINGIWSSSQLMQL